MDEQIIEIKNIEAAIEAILFAAGYPVKYEKIAEVIGLDVRNTKTIIENMSDIIGYAHSKVDTNGNSNVVLTLRSPDGSIRCGGRFKYIANEIDFTYDALTKALNEAIDKEAAETNNQFVTSERAAAPILKEYDYDALMDEFQTLVGQLMQVNSASNGAKITQIIERYLGKGKKISETTRDQAEFIHLIVTEIKEDLM